ncbi:hypothetical protein ISCGN_009168 [Ixodes scapularis]
MQIYIDDDIPEASETEREFGSRERALERAVALKDAVLTAIINLMEEFENEILIEQENRLNCKLSQQAEEWFIACEVMNGNFNHLNLVQEDDETEDQFLERAGNETSIELSRVYAFIQHYKSSRTE